MYRDSTPLFRIFMMFLVMQGPHQVAIAADDYHVLPGDILEVSVWREENLDKQILVRPDGGFSFPLAGEIQAEGKSVVDVRDELAQRLEKFIPDPAVNVSVAQIVGNKVYVLGKVATPGAFIMNHDIDVMQALSIAGGTTTFAALNKIRILRREGDRQIAITFRYAEVEKGENLEQNIILKTGDVVVVP